MTYAEQELKQLYRALREDDARRAPSFAQCIRPLSPAPVQLRLLRPLAITAAVAVFALVMFLNAVRRGDMQSPPSGRPATGAARKVQVPVAVAHPALPASPGASTPASAALRSARRRRPAAVPSISDWRSPTAALLEVPGNDLYTTVPAVGDIRSVLSD